jgi:EAL domain-containing protein (putative c-di-GMP-specific phosphodiesterase class I)
MGRSLGLTVVAEGVETPEQLETLRNLKGSQSFETACDRVQGYLISKPLPSDVATAWLHAASAAPRKTGS